MTGLHSPRENRLLAALPAIERELLYPQLEETSLRAGDVLSTAFFSFVVSLLATIYPSYRAAKINPAEALRYE